MGIERVHLDAGRKLVEAVAEWLLERADRSGSTISLARFMLVVPTAQAARSLRLELARCAGALLPPHFTMPMRLVVGSETRFPSAVEELSLWTQMLERIDLSEFKTLFRVGPGNGVSRFEWALARARELIALQRELGGAALDFADVSSRIEEAFRDEKLDIEIERWKELKKLEELVRAEAVRRNLNFPNDAIKSSVEHPSLPAEIEELVLPALADRPHALNVLLANLETTGVKITELLHGIPPNEIGADYEIKIPDESITLSSNTREEAIGMAARVEGGMAICIADPSLFADVEAAFLSRALKLHDPAPHKLSASSLGRLISRICELERPDCKWSVISSFARDNDVRAWLTGIGFDWRKLVGALDLFQNEYLPEVRSDAKGNCSGVVAQYLQALRDLTAGGIENALRKIYSGRRFLSNVPGDAEFIAAAGVAHELFRETAGGYERYFPVLFEDAVYQLEPYSPDAIALEGWLELQWSNAPKVIVCGFNDGVVPSVRAGHPYLPDRLSALLGLQTNEQREQRDAYLLNSILKCRSRGAVKILLAKKSGDGEVLKPSRLLFKVFDDEAFKKRVKTLYLDDSATVSLPPKTKQKFWDLKLPHEPVTRVSPSGIDTYLKNPLEFLLTRVMGIDQMDSDRKYEYDALQFGNICHEVLECFGKSDVAHSADEELIYAFLEAKISSRFATSGVLPSLQKATMLARMRRFAHWQAESRAEGWQISVCEKKLRKTVNGVEISGCLDRLDYHPELNAWRIIDYKTWDKYDGNQPWSLCKGVLKRVKSLQLPLYRTLSECENAEIGYLLLTDNPNEQLWHRLEVSPEVDQQLTETLTAVLEGLKCGNFADSGADLPDHLQRWIQ